MEVADYCGFCLLLGGMLWGLILCMCIFTFRVEIEITTQEHFSVQQCGDRTEQGWGGGGLGGSHTINPVKVVQSRMGKIGFSMGGR